MSVFSVQVQILPDTRNLYVVTGYISFFRISESTPDRLMEKRAMNYSRLNDAYTEPVGDKTYRTLVLAKSRAVEKLSKDIAAAIKELISGKAKS